MNLKPAMAISMYLSIITLNVNGLNAPIKRHRIIEWIKKQDPSLCCLQETHFKPKDYRNKERLKEQNSSRIIEPKNGLTVTKGKGTGEKGREGRDKGGEKERGHYD